MIGRTGRSANRLDLFLQECFQRSSVQQCLGLLIQKSLVGTTSSLGNKHEFVLLSLGSIQINLRWQIGARVFLLKHVERCHLTVSQIEFGVGIVGPSRQIVFIPTVRQDAVSPFSQYNGSTSILASRQDACGCNVCIFEQFERHKFVIGRRFVIVENVANLLQVSRTEQVGHISECRSRQGAHGLSRYGQIIYSMDCRGGYTSGSTGRQDLLVVLHVFVNVGLK